MVVFNHGDVPRESPLIRNQLRVRDMVVAREFLRAGTAVLMPARKGIGLSEGNYPKGFPAFDTDAAFRARTHAEDILPALTWIKSEPLLDATRIIVAGQSTGGDAAMYIASKSPPGVIGAINFSGGRTNHTEQMQLPALNELMVTAFGEYGKTIKVPSLWVFAENDSRFTPQTVRTSFAAFQQAGAKAKLLLVPPLDGDGHNVYHKPDVWRAAVREFLGEIGIVRLTLPASRPLRTQVHDAMPATKRGAKELV